jgi:hypothetical protein
VEAWCGSEARHSRQRINGKGLGEDRECGKGESIQVHAYVCTSPNSFLKLNCSRKNRISSMS